MEIGNEIRIKIEEGISDESAMWMVLQVIERGKISGKGNKYCWITTFTNGCRVTLMDYRKTTMFYVTKDKDYEQDR